MIRTITDYLYQIQHHRPYIEMRLARRRALKLALAIVLVSMIGVIVWALQ